MEMAIQEKAKEKLQLLEIINAGINGGDSYNTVREKLMEQAGLTNG